MARRAHQRDFGATPGERPEEGDDDPPNSDNGEQNGDGSQDTGDVNDQSAAPNGSAADDGKKPKKTIEEKRADFERLANARVSRAIDALSALNHLSSTQSYDWTDEFKEKIFKSLREKIDTVEASFIDAKAQSEGKKKTSKQLSFRL